MESIEIFVLECYFKAKKKRSFYYYSKLKTASERACAIMRTYGDVVIVKVFPVNLITE